MHFKKIIRKELQFRRTPKIKVMHNQLHIICMICGDFQFTRICWNIYSSILHHKLIFKDSLQFLRAIDTFG